MARTPTLADVKTVSAEQAARFQDGSIPSHGEGKRGSQCYAVAGDTTVAYWSYSTAIAVVDHTARVLAFNVTKYSATTNRFVHMLRRELVQQYPAYWVFEAELNAFNVQPDTLLALAKGVEVQEDIGDTVSDLVDAGILPYRRSIQEAHIEHGPYGYAFVKHSRSTLI